MASVVGYARLSTADQAKGLTLDQQVARLKEAGAGEVLVDLLSGTTTKRPKYQELLKRIRMGSVTKVVATRWDRICRSASETCRMVDVLCADDAPELQLLDDPQDLSTIGGRAQLRMLGVFAQMEAERIRERSAAGKAHRKAMGLVDVAPFGLKQVAGRLEPNRDPFLSLLSDRQPRSKADLVEEMFSRLEETLSFQTPWRFLGETYGLWKDRLMVQRLLINPALRGAKVGGRSKNLAVATWADVIEAAGGEPLIQPERHRAVEALIRGAQARRSSPDKRRQHVLSGKLICGHCGKKMGRFVSSGRNGPGTAAYRCLNEDCSWRIPKNREEGINGRRNSIRETVAFQRLFQGFADQADALAAMEERQAQDQDDLAASQPEVLRLQAKRQGYLKQMADGDAPELQSAVQMLDQQIAALIEAGTNWNDRGMPKLVALRQDSQSMMSNFEVMDRLAAGEIESGDFVTVHPPPAEEAVAESWRAINSRLAALEWTEEQIHKQIYRDVPVLPAGGNPLKPADYIETPSPRIQLIREVVQEIRVEERKVVEIKLNV